MALVCTEFGPVLPSALKFKVAGVIVTTEQVYQSVSEYVESSLSAENAGWTHLGAVLAGVKTTPALRWANTLVVKTAVEHVFMKRYGPKEVAKPKTKVSLSTPKCRAGFPNRIPGC